MFSQMLDTYQQRDALLEPIVFYRGIPDILAYAALFGFEFPPGENAAHLYRYSTHVFVALAWEEIYCTDDKRTLPFSQASEFGDSVRAVYKRFGYTLIDLPCVCVEERVDFIFRHLRSRACTGQSSHSITHD